MGSFFCLKTAINEHCALLRARIAIFTANRFRTHSFFAQKAPKKSAKKAYKASEHSRWSHFCCNKNIETSK
ncbi:hypothetical protein EC840_11154 [Rahnella sp. JUb53]|nr:hypothetical protein EC840_11154 [Rahnella sp. JUb53]